MKLIRTGPGRSSRDLNDSGVRPCILFVSNGAWNLLNFRRPVIESLIADGCRVIAAAPRDGAENHLVSLGAEFRELPFHPSGTRLTDDLRLVRDIRRLLRDIRPDAMLTYTIKPNIYGPIAARGTPTRTLATVSGLGSAFLAGGTTGKLIDLLYRLAFRRADAVFFQNDDDRALFVERGLVAPSKVRRVAGSGIDLDQFPVSDLPAAVSGPTFLLIGRMLWDKGVREFVDAARLMKDRGVPAYFQLLGAAGVDNPSAVPLSQLERWASDGTVQYLGAADDVRPAIAAADCIVLPSYREGLPRSLLEGAAMGRPLIASDVPGCRDVVEHGCNGVLCPARSAEGLAVAFEQFARMPRHERRSMGLHGRAMVEKRFAVERVIESYRSELRF